MAKRRRKGDRSSGDSHDSHTQAGGNPKGSAGDAQNATTSLGALLKAAHVEIPKPAAQSRTSASRSGEKPRPVAVPPPNPGGRGGAAASPAAELRMLNDAYAGARPLDHKPTRHIVTRPSTTSRHVSEEDRAAEQAARKRLAALVSGGVHFKVQRDDAFVQAYRSDASSKSIARLGAQGFVAEASLDLHGLRAVQVADSVANFVRLHHRRGARHLLIIVGKGLHSEDGQSALLPALIDALTQGLCAPLVRGFATAHARLGGTGAVALLLM
jgi:DNA-nicking Smr family endonuclease